MVIVGGGFGGLSAASALRNARVSVTLIDKRNYHLFRPMLYQVATGLFSGDEISSPLRSIFSRQKNVQILFDEVTGINSDERVVHLRRGDVPYDYLILATGIQYNYFGHDEWRQFASGLESLDDADIIRGKILRAFERAEEMASIESLRLCSISALCSQQFNGKVNCPERRLYRHVARFPMSVSECAICGKRRQSGDMDV